MPLRVLALAGAIALGLFLAYHFGLNDATRVQALLRPLGPLAPAAYLGALVLFVFAAMPLPPLLVVGGLLFGPLAGTALGVLGTTTGACLTFLTARALGREAVEQHLHGKLEQVDQGLAANGFLYTLVWRLVPLTPDSCINYGAGLTRVPFRQYLAATLLGVLPADAIYSYVGSNAFASPLPVLGAIGLLAVIAAVPLLCWRQGRLWSP